MTPATKAATTRKGKKRHGGPEKRVFWRRAEKRPKVATPARRASDNKTAFEVLGQ
jgi:MOSC domain-containing protein YiiM